jgi:formate hydrogenlyase transcriptional activator
MSSTPALHTDRSLTTTDVIRSLDFAPAPVVADTANGAHESAAVLKAAVAAALSGVAICTQSGSILLTNHEFALLFGYASGELPRRDIATLLRGATLSSLHAIGEVDGVRKDGSIARLKISVTLLPLREPLFVVSVLDISERRTLESQLAAATSRDEAHAALSELSIRCASAAPEQVLDALGDHMPAVGAALDIDRCVAYVCMDDDAAMKPVWRWTRTGAAAPSDDFDALQGLPWITARVRDGEAVMIASVDEVPSLLDRESLRILGTVSCAAVPVSVDGVRGVLLIDSSLARAWSAEAAEPARLLGAIVAHALTPAHALARVRARDDDGMRYDGSRDDHLILRREVGVLANQLIVSESVAIRRVLEQVQQVAPTTATVLLLGETGVGKEVFAQAIHNLSPRQRRPMIRISCAAIPAALIESELFGRERGAFTGALSRQIGRFEAANGSTIFLDEIGELPLEIQVKLLRVLQERTVERLGGNQSLKVDVRVIAATNRNLEQAVENGTFREDLFYRLNVFPITVPPLRDRTDDIPSLVWSFIDEFSHAFGKSIDSISKESLAALQRYGWPGNVRELRNVIEREMIVATGSTLVVAPPRPVAAQRRAASTKLVDVEVEHIRSVLESCRWRVRGSGGAAERLGVKPTTLESRMARLGILRDKPAV